MGVSLAGQLTLPTNPNGVVFAAEAVDVLRARSWRDVQRIGGRALQRFHGESNLPAVVYFGWRVAKDRRNQRHHQVTMIFVFDGPATAEHLALLEEDAAASAVFWSQSSIERVPPHAVPSLMVSDGRLHQLWVERDGAPVVQRLVMGERGVVIDERDAETISDEEFVPDVLHSLARPATLHDLDAELERMRLVFARHFTETIIYADGIVRDDEQAFLDRVFPPELMQHLGLSTEADRAEWLEAADRRLPAALGHHDKLALIGLFFSACYSDGSLDAREVRIVREAGERLGLTRHEVVKYLQRLW